MGSTGGGFLIGVGFCIVLLCVGGLYVVGNYYEPTYNQVMEYKEEVGAIYRFTHSPVYTGTMSSLETASPYAEKIGDALCNPVIRWMGLCWLDEYLKSISDAVSQMKQMQSSSERAHEVIKTLEMYPPWKVNEYLTIASVFGVVFIGGGICLVIRAKRV